MRNLGTEVPSFIHRAELSCQVLRKLGTEVSSFGSQGGTEVLSDVLNAELRRRIRLKAKGKI